METLIRLVLALLAFPLLAKLYVLAAEKYPSPSLLALQSIFVIAFVVLGGIFLLKLKLSSYLKALGIYISAWLLATIPIFIVTIMWMFVMGFALEGLYESDAPPSNYFFSLVAIFPIWLLTAIIAFVTSKISQKRYIAR